MYPNQMLLPCVQMRLSPPKCHSLPSHFCSDYAALCKLMTSEPSLSPGPDLVYLLVPCSL